MKCPECGKENPDNATFCEECGRRLEKRTLKERSKISFRFNNKILVVGIVAAIVIVGVLGILYSSNFFTTPSSPQNATVFVFSVIEGNAVLKFDDGTTLTYNDLAVPVGGGSGFFVTKDGYIATAAHVISDEHALKENKIKKMTDDDIKAYIGQAAIIKAYKDYGQSISEDEAYNAAKVALITGNIQVTNYKHNIYVMGPALPDSIEDPPKARFIDMGDSESLVDVALLKLENPKSSLPVLPINPEAIKVGESVQVYGYPQSQFDFYEAMEGKSFVNIGSKKLWEEMLTASLTTGIVSAERSSSQGNKFYQTDAAVDNGNSGGPVLDNENQVIGIMVMGFDKQGYNFFVPSEYLIQLCNKNGVQVGEKPLFSF